jgi:Transposase
MSTMAESKTKRRRRSYTDEFKASAVRLVLDEGRSVSGLLNYYERARMISAPAENWDNTRSTCALNSASFGCSISSQSSFRCWVIDKSRTTKASIRFFREKFSEANQPGPLILK